MGTEPMLVPQLPCNANAQCERALKPETPGLKPVHF